MRPAASAWEKDYSMRLFELGFRNGSAAPKVFYHREKSMRRVVHGRLRFHGSPTRSLGGEEEARLSV